MNNEQWKRFFKVCCTKLGNGDNTIVQSETWCCWTTFERLNLDGGYWTCGLPNHSDIGNTGITDGGVWGQPFPFSSIAHIQIPKKFYWERVQDGRFESGFKDQDLQSLSKELEAYEIPHTLNEYTLEIKCY